MSSGAWGPGDVLRQASELVGPRWHTARVIFVPRSAWGARQPKHQPQSLRQPGQRGLAVHHSGSRGECKDDHQACGGVVQAIQRYHQDARGWNDIAYSWLACQHGYLFEGRGTGFRTASQGTNPGNDAWHSVCWLGNGAYYVNDASNGDPLHAAVGLTRSWNARATLVWPHLRFHSTACPGGALRDWCRQFPDR